MHVLRNRRLWQLAALSLGVAEQLETLLDLRVVGIEVGCALVRMDGVADLVVASFVQAAKVEPDFRDVRIETDGTRVGIQCIAVLVDLVVENTDGAPEGRVLPSR